MLYATATDHINNHPYAVYLPPHVLDIHKQVIGGDLFAPLYEASDTNLKQKSMIPIAKMVELSISETSFTVINDYDILLILHQIDAYVEEVYPLRSDPRIMPYIERILKLRSKVYLVFRRVLNWHPQWKSAYSHGNDIFGTILNLYKSIGISVGVPQGLLDDLVVCPTVRNHPEQFSPISQLQSPTSGLDGKIHYSV